MPDRLKDIYFKLDNLLLGSGGTGTGTGSIDVSTLATEQTLLSAVDILTALANGATLTDPVFSTIQVQSSVSSVILSPSEPSRKSLTIFNNSPSPLCVSFQATSSPETANFVIGVGGYYEMPSPTYTGVISGCWVGEATGTANICIGV